MKKFIKWCTRVFYKHKATNFTTQEEVRNEFEAIQGTLQNAIHEHTFIAKN